MHLESNKKEPQRDETIHVGTIVRGPSGYVLVTSSGNLALSGDKETLKLWQERRVVISGVCRGLVTIEVNSIDEMMSECEILECADFLATRYRREVDQHVRTRLDVAIKCGSPQQIAIWKAISSHLKSPWDAAKLPPMLFPPPS